MLAMESIFRLKNRLLLPVADREVEYTRFYILKKFDGFFSRAFLVIEMWF